MFVLTIVIIVLIMMIRSRDERSPARNGVHDSMERKRKSGQSYEGKEDDPKSMMKHSRRASCVSLKDDQIDIGSLLVKSTSLEPDVVPYSKSDPTQLTG